MHACIPSSPLQGWGRGFHPPTHHLSLHRHRRGEEGGGWLGGRGQGRGKGNGHNHLGVGGTPVLGREVEAVADLQVGMEVGGIGCRWGIGYR